MGGEEGVKIKVLLTDATSLRAWEVVERAADKMAAWPTWKTAYPGVSEPQSSLVVRPSRASTTSDGAAARDRDRDEQRRSH